MRTKNFLKNSFLIFLALFLCSVIIAGAAGLWFLSNIPTSQEIISTQIPQSTKIYDRTGKVLLYDINAGQKRTYVPLDKIPSYLKDATIAMEDENFYTEPGFSWKSILRAFIRNLESGRVVQGGSGITQQLAKNAFLSPEQTVSRKLKELILAVKLNEIYSKNKILELYLNEIPYGSTIYGVESASEAYFNKPVGSLTLGEAALLAVLPRAPSYYSPWGSHTKELFARKDLVLKKMRDLNKISAEEYAAALKEKIAIMPPSHGIQAPHFVIMVQDYLTKKYGEDEVRTGGLKVITTLDKNLQEAAQTAVKNGVDSNRKLYEGSNAALVAEDPRTGQILAMVGSYDYFDTKNDGNFNAATQGLRQPGSTLKPFVYMTAFEKGYTPDTVLFDAPTNFDTTGANPYEPENFDGKFRGPVTLRQALSQSVNVPAVKLLYLTGIKNVLKTTYDFGIKTLTDPEQYGLSLVLGGGAVRLFDMVGAYSTLASEGIKHDQAFILEVDDANGNVLESYKDNAAKVVDAEYPRLINQILSDVNLRSGLFENSLSLTVFPGHQVALKTGTSNDYRDAWAFGYTPSLAAGVWAGNNDNAPMQRRGSSILAAVPIWSSFMSQALTKYPGESFNQPDPVPADKPILRGELDKGQIHSILYFVDKNNPQGPPPLNPAADPQFYNWERGVLSWTATQNLARLNLNLGASYTNPPSSTTTP